MREELPLHDAEFDGIVINDKVCTLYFRRADGQRLEVVLSGVDALHMDEFRQGNVVLFFETITGELPSEVLNLERLYGSPHPSAAEKYHRQFEAVRSGKRQAIEAGELILVEMQPGYGANLLATCEKVELIHRRESI